MTASQIERTVASALETAAAEQRIAAARHQALDCFLSLSADERARRWRAMDGTTRRSLVAAMLIRRYDDWSETSVDLWVDRYNARWA